MCGNHSQALRIYRIFFSTEWMTVTKRRLSHMYPCYRGYFRTQERSARLGMFSIGGRILSWRDIQFCQRNRGYRFLQTLPQTGTYLSLKVLLFRGTTWKNHEPPRWPSTSQNHLIFLTWFCLISDHMGADVGATVRVCLVVWLVGWLVV